MGAFIVTHELASQLEDDGLAGDVRLANLVALVLCLLPGSLLALVRLFARWMRSGYRSISAMRLGTYTIPHTVHADHGKRRKGRRRGDRGREGTLQVLPRDFETELQAV
jgi:hypothetical protein